MANKWKPLGGDGKCRHRPKHKKWEACSHRDVPVVPEPATYGGIMVGLCLGMVLWRRNRMLDRRVKVHREGG